MFAAFGCGVHVRQPRRWRSVTWELRRIYTTNGNTSAEAVSACEVLHEGYLRVPKYRSIHQTSTGWERAVIVYWINNHHSLIRVPCVSEASLWCHRAPLSELNLRSRRSSQASRLAPVLGWEPCPALPATAPPSGRYFLGCSLLHGQPAAPSHHRLDAAYLGLINHARVPRYAAA